MRRALLALVLAFVVLACSRDAPPPAVTTPARAPDVVRREGNHLVGAGSAYLLGHAHDPVEWYPWGPEALARAKAENKPIFLSIGYEACHYCHVMQREVFSQDDAASVLNERFISIKVDREERPDLDRVYMDALVGMTGSGGWPATLFLTPALEPFFGATYLEKARFVKVAREAATAYAAGEIAAAAAAFRARLNVKPVEATSRPSPDDLRGAATSVVERVDLLRGGFKGNAKFPLPGRWRFMLHAYRKWGDDDVGRALRTTLDAMASGALRDPTFGGFHRYTVDPSWSTPHFEEMLYDNAQLASLYLEAGAALARPDYVQIAQETLDFLVDSMTTASGTFAASFDADFEGTEGAGWTWSRPELASVLGEADGAAIASLLDVGDKARAPTQRGTSTPAALETWTKARPKLRAAHAGKRHRDDKAVTAWNGLAITALARGHAARWLDAAKRAGEQIWRAHREAPGHLVRTSTTPAPDAALDDYACLAEGYLALFEATGERPWLDRATQLVTEARTRFAAPTGGFYASDVPAPFVRSVSLDDGAEPSGNAVMLHVLATLASLGAHGDEAKLVTQTLDAFGTPMREQGLEMAGWLDAALLDAGPRYTLVIAGAPASRAPLDLVASKLAAPWIASLDVPPEGADGALAERLEIAEGKRAAPAPLRAFVCERGSCQKPTADAAELRAQLLTGWKQ